MQANDDELVSKAVEIKLRAKQRAGEMLVEGKKSGQIKSVGQAKNSGSAVRIPDIGITHRDSAEYRRLAAVPERVLEKAITAVKKRDRVLTEAAVKRELPKPPSFPKDNKQPPDINMFALKVCSRLEKLIEGETTDWLNALSKNAAYLNYPIETQCASRFE